MQDEYANRANKKLVQAEQEVSDSTLGPEQKGIVISHFGQQLDIEALEGDKQGQIFRCHQRSNLEPLVSGDYVIWQEGETLGIVVANLPRASILKRPNNFGELRPVAANIDNIVIVIAPIPHSHSNLIDRYIVAAENIGIKPTILLNKEDLIGPENQQSLDDLLAIYKAIGYTALKVSSKSLSGMDALNVLLDQQTSIFVGQSGVGKSALINALLPGVNTLEGLLSDSHDQGRHTTTAARLFHFPDGGDLIDSPGIREFGLWHIEANELINGFIEFHPFLGYCKFRDCKHHQEPQCRLLQAVEEGEISAQRMNNYKQILESLE
jgi:ribosome biogenesis GTPase / thiamine phosphate phosphatase